MKRIVFILLWAIFCLLSPALVVAQNVDERLAEHYFDEGDYEKAAMYYAKLYDAKPSSSYYRPYLTSLLELRDFKEAERLVKHEMKRMDFDVSYRIDLGEVYEKADKQDDATKEYENAIKDLPASRQDINNLANAFTNRNKLDYALSTYQRGQKLLKGSYPYSFEIANIYGMMGNFELMLSQYLDLLEFNDAYLLSVQSSLARSIDFDSVSVNSELLRIQLLKRIQKDPQRSIFSELLIWMFIQQRDFHSAIQQSKALDRRSGESGDRLLNLGKLCASNKRYDEASDCFQYIIAKGPSNFYYSQAKIELVNALNKKITGGFAYEESDLQLLENQYTSTLEELGKNGETAEMMLDRAHLHAFYIHNTQQAIAQLEELLEIASVSKSIKAKAKLELGDILVLDGSIWDASLYYGQVESDFKHDVLGHEAKFRNGRIYYYNGDFGWAQSHLDILKGSTSKLISNDAIDLSLLITDNTGLDSNPEPMLMFARADLLRFQNKFDLAITTLDSIKIMYPDHMLADEVLYRKYNICMKQQEFDQAKENLELILLHYGDDILADDALFKLAELHQYQLNLPEKAMELYKDLLTKYTASLYTTEARKRFRDLRGDKIQDGNTIERAIK